MQRLRHSPLGDGEIRLVTILPGSFYDPISLLLTRVSLPDQSSPDHGQFLSTLEGRVLYVGSEKTSWNHPNPQLRRWASAQLVRQRLEGLFPSYEALSYVWGPEEDLRSVRVVQQAGQELSGQQSPRMMAIRRNLAEALRHLRYLSRPRVMWIDAVCINQTNMAERGSQVACMKRIYGSAKRVIAWLGSKSLDSRLALSTLEYLGQQPSYAEPNCVKPDYHRPDRLLPYSAEIWIAFQNLWSRPWFNKLPNSVMKCGDDEILWSSFRRAIICICNKDGGIPEGAYMISRSLLKMCGYAQADPFELLIWKHHNRQCVDDRDRIYGLTSLAPSNITRSLTVDYQLQPWEVYKQVVLAYLATVRRLSFLPHCSVQLTAGASSASAAWASYTPPNKLSLVGIRTASIKSVESLQFKSFADLLSHMRRYVHGLENSQYPTGGTQLDGLIWNLMCGRLKDRAPERPSPTLETLRGVLLAAAAPDAEADNAPSTENLSSAFQLELLYTISMCFLFFTTEGYSGISRSEVQPVNPAISSLGDEVFIVPGCEVPMALRRTQDILYRVVGDCFVHGIMDAEAVLGPFPSKWKLIAKTSGGAFLPHYLNTESGVVVKTDPPLEFERMREDPKSCRKFRNRETGDVINSDPMLFRDALKARGINVELITVV
ncbi:HET-domain-containing protein [Xylaria castorea]|nr:HET-domain-containing protein [Xylaria castorea]